MKNSLLAPFVRIRPIRPADDRALERFYENLSPESRWARFFGGTSGLSHDQSSFFCTPDHHHREGFVAELPAAEHGSARVVGHLCLEPDGAGTAEFAIAVADALQGRAIGRRLMNAGLEWAAREGVSTVTATMLEGNVEIRRLVAAVGLPVSFRALGSNVVAVTVDLGQRHAPRVPNRWCPTDRAEGAVRQLSVAVRPGIVITGQENYTKQPREILQ